MKSQREVLLAGSIVWLLTLSVSAQFATAVSNGVTGFSAAVFPPQPDCFFRGWSP